MRQCARIAAGSMCVLILITIVAIPLQIHIVNEQHSCEDDRVDIPTRATVVDSVGSLVELELPNGAHCIIWLDGCPTVRINATTVVFASKTNRCDITRSNECTMVTNTILLWLCGVPPMLLIGYIFVEWLKRKRNDGIRNEAERGAVIDQEQLAP